MSIVSISEAARLTGKARSTIQAHIKTGKISKTTDHHTGNTGIETSELIRVFGNINIQNTTCTTRSENVAVSQQTTGNTTDTTEHHTSTTTDQNIKILQLKLENDRLKAVLEAKQETIDTLKSALKLLEHKQTKDAVGNSDTIPDKEPEPEPPLNEVKGTGNEKGLLGRFKKLFS